MIVVAVVVAATNQSNNPVSKINVRLKIFKEDQMPVLQKSMFFLGRRRWHSYKKAIENKLIKTN